MDRSRSKPAWLVLLAAMALVSIAGCNVLATALYVVQGNNTKAEFGKLRGKRVAVVCRPVSSLQYNNFSAAKELSRQVSILLQQHVKNIHTIDQREIAEWADENNWEHYTEIGKAMNADYVVGLDLEQFNLYEEGQSMYRGKASVRISVYDVKGGGDPVYEQPLPQVQYPPNSPVPTIDKPEQEFRRQFVEVLAQQIAHYFYDHDATVDFASDSTVLVK